MPLQIHQRNERFACFERFALLERFAKHNILQIPVIVNIVGVFSS